MTTTVRNMMMSVMLVGGMLMATPVSAQMSNHRRPSASGATVSSRPSSEMSSRHESASRLTETRSAQSMNNGRTRPETGTSTVRHQATVHKEERATSNYTSGNDRRPNGNGGSNYSGNGNDRRPNGNGGSNYSGNGNDRRPNGNGGSNYSSNGNDRRPNGNGGSNYSGNGNDRRPNGNGSSNYNHNGNDRNHNGGSNYSHNGNNHNDRNHNGNYGHNDHNRGHNAYRDHYSWNYHHNNWSRPLPPPARVHRPAPYYYHRPHIPVGWRPYHSAPVIDRILGITFGTTFNVSLNFLYTNGYNIDGYENNVVYLRNVNMLNLNWADVMLCYDDYGRLYNAQFIHSTYYNDRSRYNRLYHDLCAVYGSPIDYERSGVTWFGGNSVGYVTLTMNCTGSRYYTNLYIGN